MEEERRGGIGGEVKNISTDRIKDMAAKRWHKKWKNKASLADVWIADGLYETAFRLHEFAYVNGYRAAQRDARKKK